MPNAMKRYQLTLFIILAGLFLSFRDAPESPAPLFAEEDLIEMTLTADWETFKNNRYQSDPDYQDTKIVYTWKGETIEAKGGIRTRGQFRRDICDIQPIKLKIDKEFREKLFEGQKTLKLVQQCKSTDTKAALKEYYVYKTYQLFTDWSFQVRLLRLTLVDSKGKMEPATQYGFLIEDKDDLAERNNAAALPDDIPLTVDDVDHDQQTLVHVFNYMVANRDSRVEDRQNVEVITHPTGGKPVVIPYDFDNAGIVDAAYTKRAGDTKTSYYDRREFRPLCRELAEYQTVIERFEAIRPQLFALYEDSPYLDKATKKETLKYYKDFYKQIGKTSFVEEVFVGSCNPQE